MLFRSSPVTWKGYRNVSLKGRFCRTPGALVQLAEPMSRRRDVLLLRSGPGIHDGWATATLRSDELGIVVDHVVVGTDPMVMLLSPRGTGWTWWWNLVRVS